MGAEPILALNSGSSSLKFGVYVAGANGEEAMLSGEADALRRPDGTLRLRDAAGKVVLEKAHVVETAEEALDAVAAALREHLPGPLAGVGHRVVHGGPKLRVHQRITPEVQRTLEDAVHFAPLHIPEALKIIRKAEALYPGVAQFACFDTTFHRTMPATATHLPIPAKFFDEGVQRYGFHGLSCESSMAQLGAEAPGRVVIAHLGSGCSVTAVRDGRSVHTTMSLSPSGGIPMATRAGDLDPAVLIYLQRNAGLSVDALEEFVNHQCGWAGLSGGETDMRALLARADGGDEAARLAVGVFVAAVRQQVGAYAAVLGGVELLVFTGGIGEHSEAVRAAVLEGLGFLGLAADSGRVRVLTAQEELQIARHCRELLRVG